MMMFILNKSTPKPFQNPSPPSLLNLTTRFFSKPHRKLRPRNPNIPNPLKPTSTSFDERIAVAGLSNDFQTLHLLLNKRSKEGCFNTTKTFKFITENNQDPNTILPNLIQTLSNLDKGFTRKNAFDSLISHLSKSNHFDECLSVIRTMIEGEFGVNACTFHPLLNSLTRKKDFEKAWRILEFMKENGIKVDVTAYNYILTAYCFNGQLKEAAGVISKMLEEGLKEDAKTFDAMVLGACRVGKVESAFKVLRRMEDEKVSVLYCTHVHVITGLLGLGCYAQAVEFVMAYAGRDKGLDSENFGFLLSCLVRKKRLGEAKEIFGEMEKRGLIMGDKLRQEFMELAR